MEEKRSKASQYGYDIVSIENYIAFIIKAGSVEKAFSLLSDAEQKAAQESTKKEISPEDFQSFSANVNTYLDIFEKAFLANEKKINQESASEVSEIEKQVQSIRDSFKDIEEYREAEKQLRNKKEEHDRLYKQIIEFGENPVDEASKDSINYDIEVLAEEYGPVLDAYKSAKKEAESKKTAMDNYIKNVNVQDLKNSIFKQLANIEDIFKKLNLYEINGIAEALQTLRGGVEMAIGMFGITLADDKYTREYEELCRKCGVRKTNNQNEKVEEAKPEVKEEKIQNPVKEVSSEDLDEEQIKKEIMAMAGIAYTPSKPVEKDSPVIENKIEEEPVASINEKTESQPEEVAETEAVEEEKEEPKKEEIPSVPFEMPFVDSIASQLEDNPAEEKSEIATDPFFNQGVFEIPTIEDTKLDNPLDYIDNEFINSEQKPEESVVSENASPVLNEATPEVVPTAVEQPVGEPPIENIEDAEALLDEYEVPEVEEASYLRTSDERIAAATEAPQVVENSVVEEPVASLRKKIKGIRKSVSNKYLKSIMTAGAISGIAEKLTSSKVAEAVINADFTSGVEKLASKMKTFGGLSEEVYVKDASKSPKDQISEIASIAKDKFLSVYTSIKAKLKNVAADSNTDNQQLTNNVEEQLTNTEGAVR